MKIASLITHFKQLDPGFLRLKQAIKTLLAILIGLAVLHPWASAYMQLYGALTIGFAMQSHKGKSWRDQMMTACYAYPSFLFFYFLAALCKPYPFLTSALLVFSGFLVFYVQRLGPRFLVFPNFTWALCFLGSIFPNQSLINIAYNLMAMLIGCFITFMVYFFIWPNKPEKMFFKNVEIYFKNSKKLLCWLARYYYGKKSTRELLLEKSIQMKRIRDTIVLNQTIYTNYSDSDQEGAILQKIYLDQYTHSKALGIIVHSTSELALAHIHLPEAVQKVILALLTYHLSVLRKAKVYGFQKNGQRPILYHSDPKKLLELLNEFKELICAISFDPPETMVQLLNIRLGLRQLSKDVSNEYEN